MAKENYPFPEDRPELKFPDLSDDFSVDDILKELSMSIPDLKDLAEDTEETIPLADPATIDLDIDAPPVPTPAKKQKKKASRNVPEAPVSSPEEEEAPAPKKKMPALKKVLLIVAAVFLVLILGVGGYIGVSLATDPYENRILSNVTVAGIDIGGMTRKEAEAALHAATDATFSRQEMVVSLPHGTITLSPQETGAKLDVRAAVRAAYLYGRMGSKAEKQAALAASADTVYAVDVSKHLQLDRDYIREQLSAYASKHETALTQYSYIVSGTMPALAEEDFNADAACQTLEITMGTPGLGLNMDEIYQTIVTNYSRNQFQVTVEDIAEDAKPDPVNLEALLEQHHIDPVNAGLDMEKFCPVPGDYGYTFNLEEAQKLIDSAEYGETVAIPMEYITPEITQDNVYCREVLGECQTPHTDNENRNENLRIACEKLNGIILQPGEELSYNNTLGERTKDNGWKPAPAYSGTVLVDSYGGGICQVSSTLYYCALLSDLEIVSRINHGFPVGYIDLGMDATVSWGNPDFIFKNNTNFPIKIEAWVEEGYVNMRILGTIEKDYYVKMEYEIVGGENPPVTYQTHSADSGYYDGQVLYPGEFGPYVKTYRCKYDRETDELISKDFECRSHYMATSKIVVQIVE